MPVFIRTPAAPELHRDARVGRRADTRVHDDRDLRALEDDRDVVGILDPEPGADRRAERHDGRRSRVLELPAHDRIVGGVREDDESFPDEGPRRGEERVVVGPERLLVAEDFELHPVGEADLAPQPRRAHRVVGRVAAGRVRAGASSPAG